MPFERIRLKFCGMTRKQDIDQAIALGVDAIGIIMYENSTRSVHLNTAMELLANIPPFIDVVAVLVNPDKAFVEKLLETLPIQYLQFHGNETPDFCESFRFPYIKAIAATSARDILNAEQTFTSSSAILLDTPAPRQHGGTGQSFDWQIIPQTLHKPCILAGGLNEANIIQALQQVKPYAVDVCSGVEDRAGIKDYNKMKQFAQSVRGYHDK